MDNRIRIMLTDSDEEARGMLQDALERTGRFLVTASTGDGNQALQLIGETKPDILVLDLILPGLDGLGILRRLDKDKRPLVLAISNFATHDMAAEAGQLGASIFVSKPYNEEALVENLLSLSEKSGGQFHAPGLEELVTSIIHEVGVPAHIKGYQYVREAIMITVENMDVINSVTKVLYPGVAKRFHRQQRQGKTHQLGVYRHDQRPHPAEAENFAGLSSRRAVSSAENGRERIT